MIFSRKFSLILSLCFLPGAALFAHAVDIPGGAKSLKPGRYTAIVKLDDLFERSIRPVVEIWRCAHDVAHRRRLEGMSIRITMRHGTSTEIGVDRRRVGIRWNTKHRKDRDGEISRA